MTWAQMKCEGESSLWLSLFLNFVCFCFCFGFWSRSLPLGKGLTDGWCWFQGQGVDCSVTLGSYPPQGGREALECGRHLTFLLVTRATQISWSAVEKYRLVLCPAFPRGSFSSSVVYSLTRLHPVPQNKRAAVFIGSTSVAQFPDSPCFLQPRWPLPRCMASTLWPGCYLVPEAPECPLCTASGHRNTSCLLPALLGSLSLEG